MSDESQVEKLIPVIDELLIARRAMNYALSNQIKRYHKGYVDSLWKYVSFTCNAPMAVDFEIEAYKAGVEFAVKLLSK